MAERNQLYEKFGEVSEAAQLLETELGTMVLEISAGKQNLFIKTDKTKATKILEKINKSTLGQLIKNYNTTDSVSSDEVWNLLQDALSARNKLTHSFFRHHNLRINSADGRDIMLCDLEELHQKILSAWVKLNLIQGIDLHKLDTPPTPGHLPI